MALDCEAAPTRRVGRYSGARWASEPYQKENGNRLAEQVAVGMGQNVEV